MTKNTAQPPAGLWRALLAEFTGTGLLVAIVVGSGIMATELSPNDVGLQLLQNSMATVFGLAALIIVFAPVSGAHFNPVVSVVDWFLGRRSPDGMSVVRLVSYIIAQCAGGISGSVLANAMFDVPQALATKDRFAANLWLAEVVATFGLLLVILALVRTQRAAWVAPMVGAYIGAAYWFTASTSFANPAVTVGRMFSDTFAGIAPASAPAFIGAQIVGAGLAAAFCVAVYPTAKPAEAAAE